MIKSDNAVLRVHENSERIRKVKGKQKQIWEQEKELLNC
jgi:hypothetical protein